jgi:hypothetical protein
MGEAREAYKDLDWGFNYEPRERISIAGMERERGSEK